MNRLADLELCIMSCLLIKPELMKKIKFEDKHVKRYKRLWEFMKIFYERFGNFDIQLMYSLSKSKSDFEEYILKIADIEVNPTNFFHYQERLIEEYNESIKDEFIIEGVYRLANELYVRSIGTKDFKDKINKIYEMANKSFDING